MDGSIFLLLVSDCYLHFVHFSSVAPGANFDPKLGLLSLLKKKLRIIIGYHVHVEFPLGSLVSFLVD